MQEDQSTSQEQLTESGVSPNDLKTPQEIAGGSIDRDNTESGELTLKLSDKAFLKKDRSQTPWHKIAYIDTGEKYFVKSDPRFFPIKPGPQPDLDQEKPYNRGRTTV